MKQLSYFYPFSAVIAIVLFALLAFMPCATAQNYYFVKPSGSDAATGTSWNAAKQSLQAALAAAVIGDVIWVKAGVYVVAVRPSQQLD